MNTQTKEKLVSLVASGTDTYEQILRAIPELTENALYYVTHSHLDEERLLLQITPTRYSPEEEHHFLPDDRFELDDAGKEHPVPLPRTTEESTPRMDCRDQWNHRRHY